MANGTTLFMAGAEVTRLGNDLIRYGTKNILFSYYYILTMRREDIIRKWMDENPQINWFLDSGAFTYAVKFAEGGVEGLPPMRQYLQRYFSYVEECGHRWCRITEPDMDIAGVPEDKVERWRNQMLDRWPTLNITPTWHRTRGVDEWYKYLEDKRIKTLAMGSGDFEDVGLSRRLILAAQSLGKPVHGFGLTRINTVLRHLPVDSVDSTSWVYGQKAGTIYIFRANKFFLLPQHKKAERRLYRTYFKNIGCDPKKIMEDDLYEVRKANILAWKMLADRLEHLKRMGKQTHGLENGLYTADTGPDAWYGRTQPPPIAKAREIEEPVFRPKER